MATDGDDRLDAAEVPLDLLDVRHELGADDHDLGLSVVDDLRHLGRANRQFTETLTAPSLASAERDLEPLEAVLVDERDAVVGTDAGRRMRLATRLDRWSSSANVTDRPSTSSAGASGRLARVGADDVGDGGDGHDRPDDPRPNPNNCWPTLRIWISSDPSVIR